MARPKDYTIEIAERICERIASGEATIEVCRDEAMPAKTTVYRWLEKYEEFRDMYARAKEFDSECEFEEIKEIADDGTNDWMERHGKDGESLGWVVNGEHVQRSRLRVDTRKWRLSKKDPKKYGDRQIVDQTTTHKFDELSDSDLEQRLEEARKRQSESET